MTKRKIILIHRCIQTVQHLLHVWLNGLEAPYIRELQIGERADEIEYEYDFSNLKDILKIIK